MPWAFRVLVPVAAAIGIVGWVALLLLAGWWMVQPAGLPSVAQPLAVLNPGHEVAVGERLVLRLDVAKTVPRDPVDSSRWLECESGNLLTLTSTISVLPVGTYTIISDSVVIPNKVSVGDVCTAWLAVDFQINPIRTEELRLASEPFTITEEGTDG
jgi:hypothetical protein